MPSVPWTRAYACTFFLANALPQATAALLIALCVLLMPPEASASAVPMLSVNDTLVNQRGRYTLAMQAAKSRDWALLQRERSALGDYPLLAYLDYERMRTRLSNTSGTQARDFAEAQRHSPLGLRYLSRYLERAGRERRWSDFLSATSREPRSERLRCYYGRALRGRARANEAWAVAEKLWLSGRSVDKACDPLFKLWRAQGKLTDALIWERASLAFAARQGSLLRYLASLGTDANGGDLSTLRRVYREPQRSVELSKRASKARKNEILTLGLVRYSRYAPAKALQQWSALPANALSDAQNTQVEAAIAYRGLLEREESLRKWLDKQLARWGDDKLTGMRLRWAITESDWPAINTLVHALSDDARQEGTWRYWQARAMQALGQGEKAEELFEAVARERSYYGFLSADRLGLPYRYNGSLLKASMEEAVSGTVEDFAGLGPQALDAAAKTLATTTLTTLPPWARDSIWRVHELQALDKQRDALSEWAHLLRSLTSEQQLGLAIVADTQDWYRLSIDAANASKNWDAIDLRFPLAYLDAFEERATRQSLPVHQLMAIARRESAFAPSARSPVGARGLMQLMPATGRAVARKEGIPLQIRELYSVDTNLDLGSAYFRELLDRFNGNRAVALAAYNAGPNRVQHWVGQQKSLDSWVETIPYKETREYVKAVLAYSVVFAHRLGTSAPLLSEPERRALY